MGRGPSGGEGRGVGEHKDHIFLDLTHLDPKDIHEKLPGIAESARSNRSPAANARFALLRAVAASPACSSTAGSDQLSTCANSSPPLMLTLPVRSGASGGSACTGASGLQAASANDTATMRDQPARKPHSMWRIGRS